MKLRDILLETSQLERKERAGVQHDQFFTQPKAAEFRKVDWSKMGHDVMGSRSISKAEIVDLIG